MDIFFDGVDHTYILLLRSIILKALNIVLGLVVFFIGFRFLLHLIGAGSESSFFVSIYDISSIFTNVFTGLIGNLHLSGSAIFDTEALLAIIFYLMLFAVLEFIIDVFSRAIFESYIFKRRIYSQL